MIFKTLKVSKKLVTIKDDVFTKRVTGNELLV